MAISDVVDGYLARKKGQITRLGAFLDPTADKLLMASACLLLSSHRAGVDGFLLPMTVAVLIIAKDLFLLIGFIIVYFITSESRLVPEWIGKLATFLQLTMVSGVLLAPEISTVCAGLDLGIAGALVVGGGDRHFSNSYLHSDRKSLYCRIRA